MAINELITFIALFSFVVVILPLIFIEVEKPVNKLFDKSELEYKDGDNT